MATWKAGGAASLALATCAAVLLVGCVGSGGVRKDEVCPGRMSKTVKLKIKLNGGAPAKVLKDNWWNRGKDGNAISVCPGDFVVWKLEDSEFSLQFKDTGAGKVPFEWVAGRKAGTKVGKDAENDEDKDNDKWVLIDVVREDVERDKELEYDVITPGGLLDPLIIVER